MSADEREATLRAGAEAGDPDSQAALAGMLAAGAAAANDIEAALPEIERLLRAATAGGHETARTQLGMLLDAQGREAEAREFLAPRPRDPLEHLEQTLAANPANEAELLEKIRRTSIATRRPEPLMVVAIFLMQRRTGREADAKRFLRNAADLGSTEAERLIGELFPT